MQSSQTHNPTPHLLYCQASQTFTCTVPQWKYRILNLSHKVKKKKKPYEGGIVHPNVYAWEACGRPKASSPNKTLKQQSSQLTT